MADNYLITGYWGEPHVTAENDRGINAATFGKGKLVLDVGEQFRAEYIGNNTIRMYDGKLMNNGAAAGIPAGDYVDLVIPNAGQGMKRNDLIVFQYERDASTLIESGKFVVVYGTESTGTASDPSLVEDNLLSGNATFDQMALWRVSVNGATISAPVKMFSVYQNSTSHSLNKDNPHEVTPEQIGAATPADVLKKSAPVNLLDNSDFTNPVNQRGYSIYTSTSYSIDRWLQACFFALGIIDGGIELYNPEATYGAQLRQKVLWNKTNVPLTFAVCDTDGVISVVSGIPSGEWTLGNTAWGSVGIQRIDKSMIIANIKVDYGHEHAFRWAALYEGEYTAETLPEYRPKGYDAELLECLRYFYRFPNKHNHANSLPFGIGIAHTSKRVGLPFRLPVPMRIDKPTVSPAGSFTLSNNWSYKIGVSNISYSERSSDIVTLLLDDSSGQLVSGGTYLLQNFSEKNTYIDFSADL